MTRSSEGLFPRWVVVLFVVALVGLLMWALRGVLTPVFFAFLIAYMLDPLVDRFEARKIPRGVGIAVLLTGVLGALGLFLLLAVPSIVRDAADFMHDLPGQISALEARAQPWLLQYGVELPTSLSEAVGTLTTSGADPAASSSDQLAKAAEPVMAVLRWLWGGTATLLGAAASALIVPVFAAYLLHDFDRMTAGIAGLIPPKWRPFIVDIASEVDTVLGEFIRGQLIVMLILAFAYSVAYGLLGVRLAILIGVVAGMLSFIPYVGGAVALGLAVIMCLIDWTGWGQLLGVVGAYAVIQVLEGFVITPKVVGDKVGLSAIWVLFALMVGGELFGFLGVLLALPAAAVVKIFVVRGLAWYRESEFFVDGPEPASTGALSAFIGAEGLPDDEAMAASKAAARTHPPSDD
ncbi:MAG: AI-2E family transporter [Nannocystaceae bacterium]|nr:AI-2E family transporter [Nannocystaceae bacterium]